MQAVTLQVAPGVAERRPEHEHEQLDCRRRHGERRAAARYEQRRFDRQPVDVAHHVGDQHARGRVDVIERRVPGVVSPEAVRRGALQAELAEHAGKPAEGFLVDEQVDVAFARHPARLLEVSLPLAIAHARGRQRLRHAAEQRRGNWRQHGRTGHARHWADAGSRSRRASAISGGSGKCVRPKARPATTVTVRAMTPRSYDIEARRTYTRSSASFSGSRCS